MKKKTKKILAICVICVILFIVACIFLIPRENFETNALKDIVTSCFNTAESCKTGCTICSCSSTCQAGTCISNLQTCIYDSCVCTNPTAICSTYCPIGLGATGALECDVSSIVTTSADGCKNQAGSTICVNGKPLKLVASFFSSPETIVSTINIVYYNNSSNTNTGAKSWPALVSAGGIFISQNNVTALNMPLLKTLGHFFLNVDTGQGLAQGQYMDTLFFPSLTSITGCLMLGGYYNTGQYNHYISSVSLPVIEYLGADIPYPYPITSSTRYFSVRMSPSAGSQYLTRVRFGPYIQGNPFTTTLKKVDGDIVIRGPLDQETVDHLLYALASLDGTNGTTLYTNHVITLTNSSFYTKASAPSRKGLFYKSVLLTTVDGQNIVDWNGNNVTVPKARKCTVFTT